MKLREKQAMFARLAAQLIEQAFAMGYEVTLGEAWRPPETAQAYARQGKGIATSLHIDRFALDLNLFEAGVYLTATEDYRALGEWWERLHPLARWGGRFQDGNHFSLEHNGRK